MTKSIWPNVPGTELASLGWGQDGRRAVDSTMQEVWQGPAPEETCLLSTIWESVLWKRKAAEEFNQRSDMIPSLLGRRLVGHQQRQGG